MTTITANDFYLTKKAKQFAWRGLGQYAGINSQGAFDTPAEAVNDALERLNEADSAQPDEPIFENLERLFRE